MSAEHCSPHNARKGASVELPVWFEVATFVGLTVLLLADVALVGRRPHEPSVRKPASGSASTWRSR